MKRIKLITAFLGIFAMTGCNSPQTAELPVDFDFNPTTESAVTVDDYDTKEIRIQFKDDSYKQNVKEKVWTIDDKYKNYIEEIKDTSNDDDSFKFRALKPTEEGKPAEVKITVTSKDNKKTSTVSKTCSVTIKQHAHIKSDWKCNETKHWKNCEICGKKLDEGTHHSDKWETDNIYHWKVCETCQNQFKKGAHISSSEWKHNDASHWHECLICGQKANEGAHNFDANCNCATCAYHDPMFVVDEGGVLTGLTTYGKNYEGTLEKDDDVKKNDFSKAYIIEEDAFKDCKASSIVIPENVQIVNKHAFDGYEGQVKCEEESVLPVIQWEDLIGDYKIKNNLAKSNVAFVNGKFYPTLKEAIDSVEEDNTIIKLLKAEIPLGQDPIKVSHNIYIESLAQNSTLKQASFSVDSNKVLFFDKTISFDGNLNVNLVSTYGTDRCGNLNIRCYTPGTVCFSKDPKEDANVYYSIEAGGTRKALGANQTFTDIYGKDRTVFAFGTFKFNETFISVVGLTDFGKIIKELTISDFINREGEGELAICACAFNTYEKSKEVEIYVEGVKKTISVAGYFQKGIFEKAIIDVKEIGISAFEASFTRTQTLVEQEQIQTVISKLSEVVITSSVESIDAGAFRECCSLKAVNTTTPNGECNLKVIKNQAFYRCSVLESVDFAESKSLTRIEQEAFGLCLRLNKLRISNHNAWQTEDGKYHFASTDLNEESFAYLVVFAYSNYNLVSKVEDPQLNGAIFIYHPDDHDEFGYHNNVTNLTHIGQLNDSQIYNNIKNGSILHVTQKYFDNGYYEQDKNENIVIHSNHSLYIQNGTTDNTNIKLASIKVESGAYAILDSRIEVTNGIVLNQAKDLKDSGGVAFATPYQQKNGERVVNIALKGEKEERAVGFRSGIKFNGKSIKDCEVYGMCTFENCDDRYKKASQKLVTLSTLGKMCEDLIITHQLKDDKGDLPIVIQPEFSEHNSVLETIKFSKYVTIITHLDKKVYRENRGSFDDCPNLKTVEFEPDSLLDNLDGYSFANCPQLHTCDLTNCSKLYYFDEGCFQNDSSLTEIRLPDNNEKFYRIEEHAFLASGLKKFHMPTIIRDKWYVGYWQIERVDIPPELFDHEEDTARYLKVNYVNKDWNRKID